MKFSALCFTTLAFIPSFSSAAAIPDAVHLNGTLAKRGGEVNYLANCQQTNSPTDSGYPVSHIAWYANVDESLSGNDLVDSLSNEYRDWSLGGAYLTWEGRQQNIYFPDSGVTVQTHIDGDAQSRPFTAWAGWAQRTSDGKYFNCYKDNGRQIFNMLHPIIVGEFHSLLCRGIYWCV
ncbi:hypothetical protein M407DRAFT_27946 [Tulasnella calospora MUT 4182]|uniref:Ig-like domain-containing protein n=1 Tax=Tulasnella calospora MUT 4182 TaxID=1051891 RepID=A0A0C3KMF5_9AGAM|nr:hypothetical protein M407DRAFT_27946 [Tulasnella calospora MUT 4182]